MSPCGKKIKSTPPHTHTHTLHVIVLTNALSTGTSTSQRLDLLIYKVRCEENLKINSVSLKSEIILF